MANLKRIVPKLVEWTTKPGEDYTDLAEIYGEALSQWNRYVGHVLTLVAGVHVRPEDVRPDGSRLRRGRTRSSEARDGFAGARGVHGTGLAQRDRNSGAGGEEIGRRRRLRGYAI